jgi:hypothetical protein
MLGAQLLAAHRGLGFDVGTFSTRHWAASGWKLQAVTSNGVVP